MTTSQKVGALMLATLFAALAFIALQTGSWKETAKRVLLAFGIVAFILVAALLMGVPK